ncbi:MAG: PTS lactose/cellobiose transporter subunit IIA [Selenomonadaceae bacterium]|nr:PTS lactose/cellobiose transporter subunit IIA [Selenomonadaceae bacterium]
MSQLADTAFSIIAAAGEGRAHILEALKQARQGDFAKADELMKRAEERLLTAHRTQTEKFLKREAAGEIDDSMTVIVAHAQDYVMTAMTMKDIAVELLYMYRRFSQL